MKKKSNFSYIQILIFILLALCLSAKTINVYEIKEEIIGNTNYKKISFKSDENTEEHYFTYNVKEIPTSKIGAFRIDFDVFNTLSLEKNEVYCTFVNGSSTDEDLVDKFEGINSEKTSCIGQFNNNGIFEGIIKYEKTNTKLGIFLKTNGKIKFTATVYIQTKEKILEVKEQIKKKDEAYSLVPFTLNILEFNKNTPQILLYSNKELQMYYADNEDPFPKKLFSGNILLIYTDQSMVLQKYHNANKMVLLTRDFSKEEDISSETEFQVLFQKDFLLDYYVSNNPDGRSKNSPLAINMTECKSPYFFILNYNKPEKKTSLYIDQIYGKIKSLSVATKFTSNTWDDMIKNDMQNIQINRRSIVLMESNIYMDVYRLECEIPLLLNFYYVDEDAYIPDLNYGQVVITTLKPYEVKSFPFILGISQAKLSIEIFNPTTLPLVHFNDGENEIIIKKNYAFEYNSSSTENPIIIKELEGEYNTRIIIKVGYNVNNWDKTDYDNLYYTPELNMYVFSFPNDEKKLNYTYVNLITKGVKDGDNVKYCFGTNIGSAIIPSDENCYRVSKDNAYILKFLNPFIMYKDYYIETNLVYYISIKPVNLTETMEIIPLLNPYNAKERNFISVGSNIIIDSFGKGSTILTPPEFKEDSIFVQIQNCNFNPISITVLNAYNNQEIKQKWPIPEGKKESYKLLFENTFLETALHIEGDKDNKVFIKHVGMYEDFVSLDLRNYQNISYNSDLNTLEIESPFKESEEIKYTIFIGQAGELQKKGITLCSFVENQEISPFNKTFTSDTDINSIYINFKKIGFNENDKFDVLVYSEELSYFQMVFLSEIFNFTVGKVKTDIITEIKSTYEEDKDYVYVKDNVEQDRINYYYSYLPEEVFDVPFGTFSIELDSEKEYVFSRVECAFVDKNENEMNMIDAIQDVIDSGNSYCTGGKSTTNGKMYNYIFRYSYKDKEPRKLVIKLFNENKISDVNFTIYIKKGDNAYIESTDFKEEKEYGENDENKKSVIPYIIDLKELRGTSENDYISKILIYSQHFEMQMFYLDETLETNAPIKLFSGNVMLLYTKLDLAQEKYHTTKLILLTEDIYSQKSTPSDLKFSFHTKMFKTDFPIEYYLYNNAIGTDYTSPLSFQINTCTIENNKHYYIINYEKDSDEVTLYLDILFGSTKKIKISKDLSEKWDTLIHNDMVEIENYQISLADKTTHVDIIEIECNTPLLANAYYHSDNFVFYHLQNCNFAIKSLKPKESLNFTIDSTQFHSFYYSVSFFNPAENPDMTINYKNIEEETFKVESFKENALFSGHLANIPEIITVINNGDTSTRFIYKIGYGVEYEWIDEKKDIEGKLYSNQYKFVYKFPIGDNKKNFTNVSIDVKPLKSETPTESTNVKFCYSVSMGIPIDVSYENCYRSGENMPYTLTFLNPLIFPKNYISYSNDYYITLSPYLYYYDFISVEIKENKYNTKERNIEGISKVIKMKNKETSTILSIPEMAMNNKRILLQMQLCTPSTSFIEYTIINSYTHEDYGIHNLEKKDRLFYLPINNTLNENELKFIGNSNDEIFTKHIEFTNYTLELQEYNATFDEKENVVNIYLPILNENFNITILVGEKDRFTDYSLCDFVGKSENQYKDLADYIKTFQTKKSLISHYIDFYSFDYKENKEFDLLVYAVQIDNSKVEILYEVITGKVGEIDKEVGKIEDNIDDNHVQQSFEKAHTSNYLFYDFETTPTGNVSSFRIKEKDGKEIKISEVGCIFVNKITNNEEMISLVSKGIDEGKSNCIGGYNKDSHEYNGLINTLDVIKEKTRLVIKIIYDLSDNQNEKEEINESLTELNIILRINGQKIDNPNSQYNEDEKLSLIPYILDLNEIRGNDETNYISKVLLFSQNHDLNIFYLNDVASVELFCGNIMVIYTNPELIKEKYNGASTMILLTETFSDIKQFNENKEKFKVYFLESNENIQYFLSANPKGRLLNKPTSIEMKACDQPYYYILNYHSYEGNRILHLENIFGEINTIKIATEINYDNWEHFKNNLKSFDGQKNYNIEEQKKYHFDVLEVTCKTPLLLNVYYTDPSAPKKEDLDKDDIIILTLKSRQIEPLTIKPEVEGDLIYEFNILRTDNNKSPNILIEYKNDDYINIKQYGIYTKKTPENYGLIKIQNLGNEEAKIIFKFGYAIEKTFNKIDNDIYNLQKEDKKENLFAYIFKKDIDSFNYTSINLTVSTNEENVKFCYSTNLGAFITPSLHNCYRVGKLNPYTLSILNPYIMYKNYYISEDIIDYYVSFKTIDINQNITISPKFGKYSTNKRILEGYPNTFEISNVEKTLLTKPSNNEKYLFAQMEICTPDTSIDYKFSNAYNFNEVEKGQIQYNPKNNFKILENPYLDTLLEFQNPNGNNKNPEIFFKYIGTNENYNPTIKDINIYFDKKDSILHFNPPIQDEEFKYTIYIDKKDYLYNQSHNLCNITKLTKLAHYSETFSSTENEVTRKIYFNQTLLKGYNSFDVLILADNGKLMILSKVFSGEANEESEDNKDNKDSKDSSKLWILAIIIPLFVLILIAIFIFIRYKKKKNNIGELLDEDKEDKDKERILPLKEM